MSYLYTNLENFLVDLRQLSVSFFEKFNIGHFWIVLIQSVSVLFVLLVLAWAIDRFATFLMRRLAPKFIKKTKNKWDDIILKNRVFSNAAHFLPGFVFLFFNPIIASKKVRIFIENTMVAYFIIVALLLANALLNSLYDIYLRHREERAKALNIKIYLQLVKVALFSLGAIAIISIYANKNFKEILTGLGAMLTILLIVYKDTIMGFVAGIQLSANKMVKIGDWISVPKDNADGDVVDISLTTVKVQNWDKTITTIPTYKLISESFTNWIGMQESGGRRIKRHINIDIDSIHFLSTDEIEEFKKMNLLTEYINQKLEDITVSNKNVKEPINQRKLTNIGTFRKYTENYLLNTGFVNTDMTFIVRQLQPTEKGLPIEIYLFCKEQKWAIYEGVQADIFDHIFAIIPQFNLRVFQSPTGNSFSKILVKD